MIRGSKPKVQEEVKASPNGPVFDDAHADFWTMWQANYTFLGELCLRLMKFNQSQANDLLHDATLKAYNFVHRHRNFEELGNPRAWMVRIIYNCRIDFFRKQQREPSTLFDREVIAEYNRLAFEPSVEQHYSSAEIVDRVVDRIGQLPPALALVAEMRLMDRMSHKEIASLLGITEATSRKRWQLARKELGRFINNTPNDSDSVRLPDDSHDHARHRHLPDLQSIEPSIESDEVPRHAHIVAVETTRKVFVEAIVYLPQRPGRLKQKIRSAEKYIQRHPGGWRKRRKLAYLHEASGNWLTALATGRDALTRHPGALGLRLDMIRWATVTGKDEFATELLREGFDHHPGGAWTYHMEAMLALRDGEPGKAMESAEVAFRLAPGERRHRILMGRIGLELGRADMVAELMYEPQCGCPPDRERAQILLTALRIAGRDDEVEQLLKTMRRLFLLDPVVLLAQLERQMLPEEQRRQLLTNLKQRYPFCVRVLALELKQLEAEKGRRAAEAMLSERLQTYPRHLPLIEFAESEYCRWKNAERSRYFQNQLQKLYS